MNNDKLLELVNKYTEEVKSMTIEDMNGINRYEQIQYERIQPRVVEYETIYIKGK